MNKIFSINKPTDITSFGVVKEVKKHLYKIKVGHAGTLDPFATGVLVICTGKKTKESNHLMSFKKEYIAEVHLGVKTDTLDPTGRVTETSKVPNLNLDIINNVLDTYLGTIDQIPPMFSALKIKGERLYKKARRGLVVDRDPRKIKIYDINLLRYSSNILKLKIKCGKGTYIRSLARDIASDLNTVGHLKSLVRSKVGPFNLKNSVNIKELEQWILSQK